MIIFNTLKIRGICKESVAVNYDEISLFKNGMARVEKDFLFGFIDETGKEIIPCKYEYALDFSDDYTIVLDGEGYALIDKLGNVKRIPKCGGLGECQDGMITYTKNNDWGAISVDFNTFIPPIYIHPLKYSEGLACATKKDQMTGYIDKKGNIVIPFDYLSGQEFSEGLALVTTKSGKCAYINHQNQKVIDGDYIDGHSFSNGLATVKDTKTALWGVIDKKGELLIPFISCNPIVFNEGLAIIRNSNTGKQSIIDINKNTIISNFNIGNFKSYSNGLIPCMFDNCKWGYVDIYGIPVIPSKYNSVSKFSNGIAAVKDEKKNYYIDANDNPMVLVDVQKEYYGDYVLDNMTRVDQTGFYTLIITDDETIIIESDDIHKHAKKVLAVSRQVIENEKRKMDGAISDLYNLNHSYVKKS